MSVADPETGKYCMEMSLDNITGQIQYHNTDCNCLYTLNFTVVPESIITNGTCGNTTFWDYLEIQFLPYSQEIPDLWYMPWFITLRFARYSDGRFSLLNYDLNVFFGEGANASTVYASYDSGVQFSMMYSTEAGHAFHCPLLSLNLDESSVFPGAKSSIRLANLTVIANARLNSSDLIYSMPRDECGRSFFMPLAVIIVVMIVVLFVVVNIGVYAYIRRSHHNNYTVFLNA
ncbi:hypothetical protein Ddc_13227 [Ditylenchus destructor]|nr:hypothetical protein Ddc_13227 [Ditylenchus destructor]